MQPLSSFCEKTFLSLRIFNDELIPERITQDLGIEPSDSHRKGEVRVSKAGKRYAAFPSGLWLLCTEKSVESTDLSDHLDFIFKQISGKSIFFKKYRTLGFNIDLFVFWQCATFHGGPFINYVHAALLAKYKINLNFDIFS